MSQFYKYSRVYGVHWIVAFIIVAMATVSTCVKQQQLLHASLHPTVVAMKHSGHMVQ